MTDTPETPFTRQFKKDAAALRGSLTTASGEAKCTCDWATGECQGPIGCRAAAEMGAIRGEAATRREPVGYGYSAEIQSGLASYFIAVREKQDRYDTPLYTGAAQAAWQPIETAPKDGLSILLGWAGSSASEGYWHDGSKNHWKMAGFYFSDDDLLTAKPSKPTHWMHLPECPAVSSTNREACSHCLGKGYVVKAHFEGGTYTADCPACTVPSPHRCAPEPSK